MKSFNLPICNSYEPAQVSIDERHHVLDNGIRSRKQLHQFTDAFANTDGDNAHENDGNDQTAWPTQFKSLGIVVEYSSANHSTQYNKLSSCRLGLNQECSDKSYKNLVVAKSLSNQSVRIRYKNDTRLRIQLTLTQELHSTYFDDVG